jgi:hypothetical protein
MRIVMFTVYMPDRCGAFFHDVVAAKYFMSRGHQVTFVFLRRTPQQALQGQYRGIPYKYYMRAEGELMNANVWTSPHYPILGTVRKLNERFQKPIVITVHFAENIPVLTDYTPSGKWAEAVLYVSKHMKNHVETNMSLGSTIRRTDVLYPVITENDIKLPETRETGSYVTIINGNMLKGVDVFLRVADKMKDTQFLGVRPYYRPVAVHDTPNVKWENYSDDVKGILIQTRVLLVPSMTESWSRVAFEAMYNGIPVLYTKPYESPSFQGGTTHAMAEWIGDAAIACDRTNIDEWVSALRTLEDPHQYQQWSEKAREKARSLDIFSNAGKYESFLTTFVKDFPAVSALTPSASAPQQSAARPPTAPMLGVPRMGNGAPRFSLISGLRKK